MKGLQERLDALRATPADDLPELRYVEGLLERAGELGAAGVGLEARAEDRLKTLEEHRDGLFAELRRSLEVLSRRGLQADTQVQEATHRGEHAQALRLLHRQLGQALPRRARGLQTRLQVLNRALRQRGLRLPAALEARLDLLLGPVDVTTATALAEGGRTLAQVLGVLLLEHASRGTRTITSLRRAARRRPEVAGPYNPSLLVARLFDELKTVSPEYLQDMLELHARYGALLRLPETVEEAQAPGRGRRRSKSMDPAQLQARRWVARS
ncbi:MAG: DUF2894 domain-containing protein [Pseudomonadota bacterium]